MEEMVTGNVTVVVGETPVTVSVTVSAGPAPLSGLLPLFNEFAGVLAEHGTARAAAQGRSISCRAGCGACCRQPVPLAPSEARAMAALVAAMPEPRQSAVRARFAAGKAAFAAAGVRVRGDVIFGPTPEIMQERVAAYMGANVSCPFLEAGSCSIYPDRPTICREYLVTSPAANCASPQPETIARVEIAGSISTALATVDAEDEGLRRVLMIDALDWVAEHPAREPRRTGPQLVEAVFARLGAKE